MGDFDQLIADIEAEAEAEGPQALAELHTFRDQFRLASEIITLRSEANLTQKQLAERAGVQQADISRIERGEIAPTGPTFGKLATALGVGFGFYRRASSRLVEPVRATVTNLSSAVTGAAAPASSRSGRSGARRATRSSSSTTRPSPRPRVSTGTAVLARSTSKRSASGRAKAASGASSRSSSKRSSSARSSSGRSASSRSAGGRSGAGVSTRKSSSAKSPRKAASSKAKKGRAESTAQGKSRTAQSGSTARKKGSASKKTRATPRG